MLDGSIAGSATSARSLPTRTFVPGQKPLPLRRIGEPGCRRDGTAPESVVASRLAVGVALASVSWIVRVGAFVAVAVTVTVKPAGMFCVARRKRSVGSAMSPPLGEIVALGRNSAVTPAGSGPIGEVHRLALRREREVALDAQADVGGRAVRDLDGAGVGLRELELRADGDRHGERARAGQDRARRAGSHCGGHGDVLRDEELRRGVGRGQAHDRRRRCVPGTGFGTNVRADAGRQAGRRERQRARWSR